MSLFNVFAKDEILKIDEPPGYPTSNAAASAVIRPNDNVGQIGEKREYVRSVWCQTNDLGLQ